ncbi:MAG TPA: helix-turn-helix transcriptional regulator, partial [Pseudonocardiaceae bacterium]|nr:helix-turn-helix transcriptional regulator [Pseudonocardiaceae bacterium]
VKAMSTHQAGDPPPVDPELYQRDTMRAALARHDFATVYRALTGEQGLSQRRIATLTGQTQSEVSDILTGRRVLTYAVLRRIVTGLHIPPGLAGLSEHDPAEQGAYPERVTVADPEGVEAMLRRHLIAQGGKVITGAVVAKLGALLAELPGPPPTPLPTRLDYVHVTRVRGLTRQLGVGDVFSDPDVCSAAAAVTTRLLDVSGPEPVKHALMTAIAELHSEAGWAAFDAGQHQRALRHHAESLELATQAGDTYLQALALTYAGLTTASHGHPDDGLKMLQCAQVTAWNIPTGENRAVVVGETGKAAVEATALEESSTALAHLGDLDAALTTLAKARDLWTPAPADPFGDMDRPAASLELARGRLDIAEQFAAASVRRWKGGRQLSRTVSGAVLATVYVKAGDSRGLPLAHQTITDVSKLRSVRTRQQWLLPLAAELDTRPGTDARDLARQARQIATTRV